MTENERLCYTITLILSNAKEESIGKEISKLGLQYIVFNSFIANSLLYYHKTLEFPYLDKKRLVFTQIREKHLILKENIMYFHSETFNNEVNKLYVYNTQKN